MPGAFGTTMTGIGSRGAVDAGGAADGVSANGDGGGCNWIGVASTSDFSASATSFDTASASASPFAFFSFLLPPAADRARAVAVGATSGTSMMFGSLPRGPSRSSGVLVISARTAGFAASTGFGASFAFGAFGVAREVERFAAGTGARDGALAAAADAVAGFASAGAGFPAAGTGAGTFTGAGAGDFAMGA